MRTVYSFVRSPNHVYPDHPERPERLDILEPRLSLFNAERIETKPATHQEIEYVHHPGLVAALEKVCREQAPGIIDYAPTYVTRSSFDDALLAAGGVITCTRAILNGNARNAFAIVRPPGHHAERSEEHTSELQSLAYLVCRLLLEKKKQYKQRLHKEQVVQSQRHGPCLEPVPNDKGSNHLGEVEMHPYDAVLLTYSGHRSCLSSPM